MDALSHTTGASTSCPSNDIAYLKSFLPQLLFWDGYTERVEECASKNSDQVELLRARLPPQYAPPKQPIALVDTLDVLLATMLALTDGAMRLPHEVSVSACPSPVKASSPSPVEASPSPSLPSAPSPPKSEASPSPAKSEPRAEGKTRKKSRSPASKATPSPAKPATPKSPSPAKAATSPVRAEVAKSGQASPKQDAAEATHASELPGTILYRPMNDAPDDERDGLQPGLGGPSPVSSPEREPGYCAKVDAASCSIELDRKSHDALDKVPAQSPSDESKGEKQPSSEPDPSLCSDASAPRA